MRECDADVLVEIRDILCGVHDKRVGGRRGNGGLSLTEFAALRDCIRRINDILTRNPPTDTAKEVKAFVKDVMEK